MLIQISLILVLWTRCSILLLHQQSFVEAHLDLIPDFGLRSSHSELQTPNLIHTEKAGRTESNVIKNHSLLFRRTMFCHHLLISSNWIRQHASRVSGSWILIGWFHLGAFGSHANVWMTTKHPNTSISDTNVRIRFVNVRMRTETNEFASEIRIKWRWAFTVSLHGLSDTQSFAVL